MPQITLNVDSHISNYKNTNTKLNYDIKRFNSYLVDTFTISDLLSYENSFYKSFIDLRGLNLEFSINGSSDDYLSFMFIPYGVDTLIFDENFYYQNITGVDSLSINLLNLGRGTLLINYSDVDTIEITALTAFGKVVSINETILSYEIKNYSDTINKIDYKLLRTPQITNKIDYKIKSNEIINIENSYKIDIFKKQYIKHDYKFTNFIKKEKYKLFYKIGLIQKPPKIITIGNYDD